MQKTYRKETNCLNCGAEVTNKFCPSCGQENIEIHENFFHLIREYISDSFNYDSKILKSLVPLITKPGFLTKEYWDGKRASYIHPLRIFFYVTVIFALATSILYDEYGSRMKGSMVFENADLAKIDSIDIVNLKPTDSIYIARARKYLSKAELLEIKTTDQRMVRKLRSGIDIIFINFKYVTFFLLPFYALIFKMFFRNKRKFYIDHIIYTIHLQTFAYCLFSVLAFSLYLFSGAVVGVMAFILIAVYIGISTTYLYHIAWWKTILNSFFITFILSFSTGICILVLAFIDAIFIE